MALDFTLSEEQKMIKDLARDIMKDFIPKRQKILEKIIRKKEFPQEIWDALANAGFFGSFLPKKYGGTEMGLLAMTFAMEELASLGFSNVLMIITVMDALCILRNGTEELKKRFLPAIAEGRLKFCFALTEPDAGSNTFRINTIATKKGDHFVINGSKTFITGVDVADYMLLVTRTTSYKEVVDKRLPKAYGLSLFVVDTKADGITKHPLPTRGIEGMNQFTLFFDNVEVPCENLVGDMDGGTMALFKALNPERILAAATTVGLCQYCLDVAVNYAKERKVFRNTPIGTYQAIQHPLADLRIRQEAVRLLTYKAAWAFDRDLNPTEIGMYANMAKYLGAELAIHAADRAIETLGGNGFSEEYGIAHLWEAARLLKTAPVTKEMILNYVAEHILDLPRSY